MFACSSIRGIFACVLCSSFLALSGCHPEFTGTTASRTGDGTGPKPSVGQAQVLSLSPSTIAAAGSSFTLTATGLNFTSTTSLVWGGTTLNTTYISPTILQAQVPSSLIAKTDTETIVPTPLGTINYGATFTVTPAQLTGNPLFAVSKVAVQANDIVWSPTDSRFYVALASRDSIRPSTISSLDPQSGQFGSSVSTGSNPGKIAISADGGYLYTSLNDSFGVRRYTLPFLRSDINIPLNIGSYPNYYAGDLQVQPTNSRAISVVRLASNVNYPIQGDVAIYDDATSRTQTASSGSNLQISKLLWNSNGQNLYGVVPGLSTLYSISVDSQGAQIKAKPATTDSLNGSLHFDSSTGYLYSDTGAVLDPETASVINRFPVNALQGGFYATPLMIPDSKLKIAYFLGSTINGPGVSSYVIEAFDLNQFTLLGTISIPNVSGTPYKFFRWGNNGLAFLTIDYSGTAAAPGVYLVSGAFVTSPAP